MIIERYLKEENLERFRRDFKFLLNAANNSFGEIELAFRKGRVSVYYRGNSLATIHFRPAGLYNVVIHKRFLNGVDLDDLKKKVIKKSSYFHIPVNAQDAHRLLQRKNLTKIKKAIRDVNHSEELIFEQILITDNQPSPRFMIIDRQVQDSSMPKGLPRRLDLLGLRRLKDGRYGFVVIEVKMGNNGELSEAVAKQLNAYVRHISRKAKAYKDCYEKNYEQKRKLKLIDGDMPEHVEIDGKHVEGVIVVGGYSQQAEEQRKRLQEKHNIKVHIFSNRLFDKRGRAVWTT